MHKKILLSISLFVSSLFANSFDNSKFQILSNTLDTKQNTIIASGNVVIFSKKYYITAQKVIYDKEKGVLELFDDVVILKDNEIQTQSNYAFLDLNDDSVTQNPILVLEKKSNVWITSNDARKEADNYAFENSILSSCDCIDPAWNIRFSSADYDSKDEWLDTYNTRLYIKNVPVLYTPYLGFSTNTKRRTGLLVPTMGYSNSEGFLYSQPIFIAPEDNYDIEFVPQVRTNRGYGMYAYYRLIDSQYSNLKLKTGYFKENSNYYKSEALKNDSHFGWSLDYERSKLFSNNDSEDGLYTSINWLNDIEFYTIEDKEYTTNTEQKVESKINYYFKNSDFYFGTYLRHYIDTDANNNDKTLQQLPQVQVHKFNENIFLDKLLYSADLQSTNYYIVDGIGALKTDLIVPISYSFSFFDEYLKLTLKEEISFSDIDYSNSNTNFKDAKFIENRHIISLNSDLLKKYDTGIHTINLSSEIVIPEVNKISGDIYFENSTNNVALSAFPISKTNKTLTFAINQSWTDLEDLKEIINHKIKQTIIYDNFDNSKLGELENEIRYNYFLGSIFNRVVYNNLDDKLVESSSSLSFKYLNYDLTLGHYMSKDTLNSDKEELESYLVKAGVNFYNDYSFSYQENYNINESLRNKQSFIFGVNDKCWSVELRLEKEIIPSSTLTANRVQQDIVYLQVILNPLGGLKQEYQINGK